MAQPPDDLFTAPADLFEQEKPKSKASQSFMDSVSSYVPDTVKSGWEFANKPLSDYITSNGQKIFDPKAAADFYDVPSDEDWRIPFTGGATWKGLGAGLLEGAGNVVSGFTSPLNLATMGTLKGASSLAETAPVAARALGMTGRALSVPVAATGAATALNPNLSASERLFGAAQAAGGAAGVGSYPELPVRRTPKPNISPEFGDLTSADLAGLQSELNRVSATRELPPPEQGGLPPRPFDRRKSVMDYQNLLDEGVKQSTPKTPTTFDEIQKRMYELVDKEQAGTLTDAELREAQALNKIWRNHPEFGKDVPQGSFGPSSEFAPKEETGLATREKVFEPELVQEGAPQTREELVASGEKVPDFNKTKDNMVWVDNLHAKGFGGYTDRTSAAFIEDTLRMRAERLSQESQPGYKEEAAKKHQDWVDQATERNEYEGHFTENGPNTRPLSPEELTPEQRAVQESHRAVRAHSDEYSQWFSQQEEQLPEGEYFKPPPEVRAKYDAEQQRLKDIHDANYQAYKASKGIPREMADTLQIESGETGPNASGESAASSEAMSRQKGMRDRGEQYVVYDRAGRKRVLVGPEAVDYQPANGETYGIETPRGFVKLTDNGGNTSTAGRVLSPRRAKEYPGFKGTEELPSTADEMAPPAELPRRQAAEFGPVEEPPVNSQRTGQPRGGSRGGGNQPPNQPPTGGNPPGAGGPPNPPRQIANIANQVQAAAGLPAAQKVGLIRQLLGANKALLTSWDLSAPGRQGKAFLLNKSWWTSLDDMAKAWGSKQAADLIHDSIENHPSGLFKPGQTTRGTRAPSFAEKVGLELPLHEEMFQNTAVGRLVDRLGLINRSSRAHTAFLNKVRSDQFASFADQAKKVGRDITQDIPLAKAYAKFINDATGRGSLNLGQWKLQRNANVLNDIFFAPKNMSGQIRTWNAVLNPIKYYQADPVLRKQALRSLFAIAGTGLAVGEIAKLVGGQVSDDPTSADFRKIKVGNVRIDPFGGYQQFPVAAMKLMMGESTSTTTGKRFDLTSTRYGAQTRGDVAERFFVNRLAPLPSFVWAWMNNRDFDGKPFEAKKALFERTVPIVQKDIIDMIKEDPALAAVLAPSTIMGLTGTQVYTGR
jgi:hypothetical protein